jgi:restriction endonuclease Mrr
MPTASSPVPTFGKLMNPILRALHRRGSSASIQELVDEVIADMGLREEISSILTSFATFGVR